MGRVIQFPKPYLRPSDEVELPSTTDAQRTMSCYRRALSRILLSLETAIFDPLEINNVALYIRKKLLELNVTIEVDTHEPSEEGIKIFSDYYLHTWGKARNKQMLTATLFQTPNDPMNKLFIQFGHPENFPEGKLIQH
jgi:hypothetical protein